MIDRTSRLPRTSSWLWRAYERVAMALGLGTLALLCLAWLPFALLLHPLLPERLGRPLGRRVIMGAFRIYLHFLELFCACRFDLAELDRLRGDGALVLVANHPSLLDVVMIVSRLPNAACVMKATLMRNLLLGSAARLARYIPNDVAVKLVLNARGELQENSQLLIFPEGTRTTAFPIGPCTPGAGLIARSADVPVQTLLIDFDAPPYLGKSWPLFRRPSLPLRFRVRLGRRFEAPKNAKAFARQLETYFRDELDKEGPSAALAREALP